MRVLEEFQHCSVETDGVQLLRTKCLGWCGQSDFPKSVTFRDKGSKLETIASRLEAIASRLEAIASRLEAIASRLE